MTHRDCAFCGERRNIVELRILWYSNEKYSFYCETPCFERAQRIRERVLELRPN